MADERKLSKKELNMLIMKLPSPVREHSERSSLLASFIVERIKDKAWFLKLGIEPQNIIDAVYYHDIGKVSLERDYHYSFHCTVPHRRKIYESHVDAGIETVREELLYYLPAYSRPSFEWCLCKAITEHHEELNGKGFPKAKTCRNISLVGRIAAIADKLDNLLYIGLLETFDFDSAVSELRGMTEILDKKLLDVLFDDIDNFKVYAKYIFDTYCSKPSPDRYGIKLQYEPIFSVEDRWGKRYRVTAKVNDPYYGLLKGEVLSPIGDRSGQFIRFEKLAFRKLCEDLDSIWTPTKDIPSVLFSISAQQFKSDEFYKYVVNTLQEYEIECSKISFAVLEADMISSAVEWSAILDKYAAAGFGFVAEGLGDKFSILPALDDLPIKTVCMKEELLEKMGMNTKTKSYVIGIIKMLHYMDVDVMFADVRRKSESDLLTNLGVKHLRGAYYGEPLTIEQLRGDEELEDKEVAADE